ncbi:MAG: AmmeMemoRadiSam system radical SAM enzyme, partial [Gammaproteobacteria bacterium]
VDLKAFTDRFYHKLTGSHLQPVLETLEYIKHETNVWLELTTLIIPGENDSEEEIEQMTQWVVQHLGPDVPMHFSVFHPEWKMMDTPSTPPETVLRARQIAINNGVHYAYVGNMHDKHGDSSWCYNCGALLIGRDWYELSEWQLTTDGCCLECGTRCAGVFEAQPGTWGAKRVSVNM